MESTELLRRARWSYELGRLRVALPGVTAAAVLIAYALARPHLATAPMIAGGLLLATLAVGRRVFLGGAGGIGTLAGALGCLEFGAFGLLLLVGGFALVLSPTWALTRSVQVQ